MATSVVVAVMNTTGQVWAVDRFVSLEGAHIPPFSDWDSAATNLQAAVDVAQMGDRIRVTNGIYRTGGRAVVGDLTNRVVVDKALTIESVNGAEVTFIEGQWDPVSTNGPAAVRCAWVANGARLIGFTFRNGATRGQGSNIELGGGGAIWGNGTNAVIRDSCFTNNSAQGWGGAARGGWLSNCVVVANTAGLGGGTYSSMLESCLVISNRAINRGGGCYGGKLYDCQLVGNYSGTAGAAAFCGLANCGVYANQAFFSGGGLDNCSATNCTVVGNVVIWTNGYGGGSLQSSFVNSIVWGNHAASSPNYFTINNFYQNTCSTPLPPGTANLDSDPILADQFHLASNSPVRGMGAFNMTAGKDVDGDAWQNPPSIGYDEVIEADLTGPLAVQIDTLETNVFIYRPVALTGRITGRPSHIMWSFGNGIVSSNLSFVTSHAWTNPGTYLVEFTAYNPQHPQGISTNLNINVMAIAPPVLIAVGINSTNIQLEFTAQNGVLNSVEFSANLSLQASWSVLTSLQGTGGVVRVVDAITAGTPRFYRVKAQ